MNTRACALIPALNEEATIFQVVQGALRHLSEVLVIDDGSQDRTSEEAANAGAAVLRNDSTLGQGGSLRLGLRYLFDRECRDVVMLDGDGAHDPDLIPRLLRSHRRARAEVTLGSRFLDRVGVSEMPSPKRSANRFATGLVNTMLGARVSDAASGMRVVTRAVNDLPFGQDNFAFAFELLRLSRLHGLALHESPIRVRYDARELNCTNQVELLDLLDYCASVKDAPPSARRQCEQAVAAVSSFEMISARVDERIFVFHPMPSHNAYIIQEQDRAFRHMAGPPMIRECIALPK